jgi:signal transduction histidine kinase
MNILVNAIDAVEEKRAHNQTQQPATIRIRTAILSGDRVSIQISDNGSGIDPSIQKELFNPFFTTKPVGKGIGMGLAISYQIITAKHGGVLQCRSIPGANTEFTMQIPLRQTRLNLKIYQ